RAATPSCCPGRPAAACTTTWAMAGRPNAAAMPCCCRTPPAAPSSARPAAEPASGAGRPVFHLEHGVCPGRDDVADPQVAMDGDEIAVPLDAAEMAFQPCAHDGRPLVFDAQPQGPQPPDLAPLVMHEGGHEGVGQGGEKAAM